MNNGLLSISIFLIFHFSGLTILSQPNKPHDIHFYLLTYSSGKELYSSFGHSAIRYINKTDNIDVVYNYGTFDFNDPDFYSKFIGGKLNYQLSRVPMDWVVRVTEEEDRCLYQNEILITYSEKIALLHALEENFKPENRYYRYEFLYDNCATRIADLIDSVTAGRFSFNNEEAKTLRFNQLITTYFKKHPWANLGFSFVTGTEVLKMASFRESQFLPQYLQKYLFTGFDNSKKESLLDDPVTILYCNEDLITENNYTNPLFLIILCFWIIIKGIEIKKGKDYLFGDWIVFIPAIILGVILLGLWLISEHKIFAWNYNLLWANPLLVLLFIPKYKSNRILNSIFLILFVISLVLTILLKGFYLPVIVLILIQALRLKLKRNSI